MLDVVVFAAHPDDAEAACGGLKETSKDAIALAGAPLNAL